MSKKIQNPIVLIHKRENSDSYAVAITSGSQNYHDALLMASMEPDMVGDDIDTWSKTGYYMAEEIERMRNAASLAIARLDSADDSTVWQAVGFAMAALECGCSASLTSACDAGATKKQQENGKSAGATGAKRHYPAQGPAQGYRHVDGESHGGRNSTPVNASTTGKPLTITLPDISSKAFWSGTGKHEVFHPETYKRWVKEAIERDCVLARIGVEVK